jgi:transcriptional regulator with GAF, ATPase, and Fis domain
MSAAPTVWLYYFGQVDASRRSVIAQTLLQAGLNIGTLNLDAPRGPGIVVFTEITQPLCDFLLEISRNGLERVLAVAASSALVGSGAWRLLQAGASDVLAWDSSADPAGVVAARLERWKAVDDLLLSPLVQNNLVGQSPAWTSVLRQVMEVARFTDASILIMGETGTGKELVARMIHTLDARPNKTDLVVLDCTTIVPELSGSEFFGHERGAFTGAVAPRDGAFALADGGTLFLDEVGELSLELQVQLLRVVQEHTYKRVGSNTWRDTHFRLVCATNKDLFKEEAQGQFRRDLYYRIASWTCRLPPLRERVEDILPLARHFIQQLWPKENPLELDESVCEYLLTRNYPGNVRDLKQLVSRIIYRHVGPAHITIGDIPEEERPSPDFGQEAWRDAAFEHVIRHALSLGVRLKEIRRAVDEAAVRIAVTDENGNLQRAARKLGVTDRALQLRRAARQQFASSADGDRPD